jgi:hypothetical protein
MGIKLRVIEADVGVTAAVWARKVNGKIKKTLRRKRAMERSNETA